MKQLLNFLSKQKGKVLLKLYFLIMIGTMFLIFFAGFVLGFVQEFLD